MVTLIGEHPLAKDERGELKNNIGDVILSEKAVITGPGIHDTLFLDYIDHVEEERKKQGQDFTKEERDSLEDKLLPFVRLHMKGDYVLIRTDCGIDLAFEADEVLQQIVPKEKIKFLGVLKEGIRLAIKKRGELWRNASLPKTIEEMKEYISKSKTALNGIAYHGDTGERFITYEEFEKVGKLPTNELAMLLNQIKEYFYKKSTCGEVPELGFFMAEDFNLAEYKDEDFTTWDAKKLRFFYEALKSKFWSSVKSEFRKEDLENEEFRKAMYSKIIGVHDDEISEEELLGLSTEFYMHIQWLPGARIEHGEVIFDSIFDNAMPKEEKIYDEKVRSIILNFRREYDDIEYINVGRVIGSLSKRAKMPGRREVYIVEVKIKGEEKERKRMIRLQKFGAVERLQSGEETDIYKAFWNADEYKRYTLDRWNACEQLGMKLLPITTDDIYETIDDVEVPLIYFERGYIEGRATDKIPASRFENNEYAVSFAELLGEAAVVSMVTGRVDEDGAVHFDDGDEIIIEDEEEMPCDLINADITSSFGDYTSPLMDFAEAYAQPVIKRAGLVEDIRGFAQAYTDAFIKRFRELQQDYRSHGGSFDSFFNDRKYEQGSIAQRWKNVLERLDNTDADALGNLIMSCIKREIK